MDLAYELHDLVLTLDRWAEQRLRPHGLTYNRYAALVIVAEHPGITGRQLAGPLRVSEPGVSGILRDLLEAGLIENTAPAGAGHVRHLRITARGAGLLKRCSRELGSSLDDNARAIGLDPQELARTIRALHDEVRTVQAPQPAQSEKPTSSSREAPTEWSHRDPPRIQPALRHRTHARPTHP